MIYCEAPSVINFVGTDIPKLFLSGGITGCPDWQKEVVNSLSSKNVIVFNPRRKSFNIKDSSETYKQIKWEHDRLLESDIISFWFCKDTLQPIVLFELGKYGFDKTKKLVVGIEPGYLRSIDVLVQVKLDYNDFKFYDNLSDFTSAIISVIDGSFNHE